jgi:hypothetical protein
MEKKAIHEKAIYGMTASPNEISTTAKNRRSNPHIDSLIMNGARFYFIKARVRGTNKQTKRIVHNTDSVLASQLAPLCTSSRTQSVYPNSAARFKAV